MAIFRGKTIKEAIKKGLDQLDVPKERAHIRILQAPSNGILGFGKKEAQVEIKSIAKHVLQQANRAAVRGVPEEITSQAEPVKSAQKVTIELSQIVAEVKKNKNKEKTKEQQNITEKKNFFKIQDEESYDIKVSDDINIMNDSKNLNEKKAIINLAKYLTKITKELGVPAQIRVEHDHNTVYCHLDSEKQGMLIGKHGKILNALQYIAQIFIYRFTSEKLTIIVNVGDYRTRRKKVLIHLAKKTAEQVKTTKLPVFLEPMPAFERKQIHFALMEENNIKTHSEGEEPFRYLVVEYAK
ncbi:MAG: protein jag [Streptococcaceae bacterium]|jgi:spoIIIJ-associated protein|nr:protein jag [Streptococcaceae bacterium]